LRLAVGQPGAHGVEPWVEGGKWCGPRGYGAIRVLSCCSWWPMLTERETISRPAPPRGARRSAEPVVAILCPAGWGLRNFVHGGIVAHLHERGIRAHVLMPDGHLRVAAGDLGTAAAGAELLALPAIRSQRGHAAFNALLRASFARR